MTKLHAALIALGTLIGVVGLLALLFARGLQWLDEQIAVNR